LAGSALLAGAGFKLGENYREIDKFLGPASNAVLVILVAPDGDVQ